MVGVLMMLRSARLGAWIVAITMAGAFVFGFVNHFIFGEPGSRGSRRKGMAATLWRRWRVLLAGTEALASVVALQLAQRKEIMS